MSTPVAAAVLASAFTVYLPPQSGTPRIEAITSRGVMLEMIVRCRRGTAIISYSKVERLYCDPRHRCGPDRAAAMRRACS